MFIQEPSIHKIIILDSRNVPKYIEGGIGQEIKGDVTLEAGAGIAIEHEDGNFLVSVDTEANIVDQTYQQKWIDIIKGNPPFSGMPYYIASLNNIKPRSDIEFFLLGHVCSQIGVFEDGAFANEQAAQLEIFDMCEACVDCEDYDIVFKYIERIEEWVDENKDNNLTEGTRLFKQYQATVHYWNYLVHAQSLILQLYGSGSDCVVKIGYRCLSCSTLNNVTMTLSLTSQTWSPGQTKNWELLSVAKDPGSLSVSVLEMGVPMEEDRLYTEEFESESDPEAESNAEIEITIASITKGQYVVVTLLCEMSLEAATEALNTYFLSAYWYNTHLGPVVHRTRSLSIEAPA